MSTGRVVAAAAGAALSLILLVSAAAASVVGSLTSPLDVFSGTTTSGGSSKVPDAVGEIPVRMYSLYRKAASECRGLPWTLLAAFGKAASDHGRRPTGRGIMGLTSVQFEEHADPVPVGDAHPPSPLDPTDAVYATERALCLPGAGPDPKVSVTKLVGDTQMATRIIELSDAYHASPPRSSFLAIAARSAPSTVARIALDYAGAQLGLPYVWGGDGPDRGPDSGFDCSGLTQSAFQAAGIAIPRTATAQFTTGREVVRRDLRAGDLVFYGDPHGFLHHVAIYVGDGFVIDAPRPGLVIRLDPVDASDYAGARRES